MENINCNSCSSCSSCSSCLVCSSCSACSSCSYCYGCYYCSSCYKCSYCFSCSYCSYCSSCFGCSSCSYCYGCYYCSSCYKCSYCFSCSSCSSCYNCINLKMTEYNYFCYADDNNKDGYQQKKYRIFNKEVTREEYNRIEKIKIRLDFKNKTYKEAFVEGWNKLDQEDKNNIINLPGFDKGIFKNYWGVDIDNDEIIEVNGKRYKLIEE